MAVSEKMDKEEILKELIERGRYVAAGLAVSEDPAVGESQALIDQLVSFGRISSDEGQILKNQVSHLVTRSQKIFAEQISNIVADVVKTFDTFVQSELGALEKRIHLLEARRTPTSKPFEKQA